MSRMAMLTTVLVLLLAGSARAAGPGEVFLTGALDLPPGSIAGGNGGYFEGEPTGLDISGNGRYVAFTAAADALSSEAHPDVDNVFRKDRVTGDIVLVGRATGTGGAVPTLGGRDVTISDDGGRVAWGTSAALDPADVDTAADVYVRDVATATTLLATPGTTTGVGDYDLSGNGNFVAFATSTSFAAADANAHSDVYRRRLSDGQTLLASRSGVAGAAAKPPSPHPRVSR